MKKRIYIIDVSSMFFRAFYAVRPLTSTKGVPVNAVYGFISMIVKLIKDKNPDHMVFCYDRKEPSFRKDLYTEYKANRSSMPDDLQVQMPYLKQVANLFGICDLEVPTFEADDLIGTIAKMAEREDYESYIVSGDKDFCQLISDHVFLYDTMKDIVFTPQLVKEKHGVFPEQFLDYLAITGDTSDNIPGVGGIGPKGAIKLIEQFGSVDGIYKNLDKIESASIKQKLVASEKNAFLSKKLVTIVCDVPLNKTLDDFKLKEMKRDELRAFLQELNFKTFEKSILDAPAKPTIPMATTIIETVSSGAEVVGVIEKETSLVPIIEPKLWNTEEIQLRINEKERFFIFEMNEKIALGFSHLLYVTEKSNCRLDFSRANWSGFNLKNVWHEIGFKVNQSELVQLQTQIDWDLMLGAYVIRAADSSSIRKLASFFLNEELPAELTPVKFYETCMLLNDAVQKQLEEKQLFIIYKRLEKPLIPILFAMELKGITIDIDGLKSYSQQLADELAVQESKIYELAGESFNIASPKQLGVILFEKMGLEAQKKTKTGYSTDNDVLEGLEHPIGKEIINYRELAKLKSTYVDALPAAVDQSNRVHTSFNQALTTTGRLSSTNPNIQNIPIKTERGQRVRKSFIAAPGMKLLSVDYSQIELRVLAHISEDPGLISAFQNDLDIHAATAAEVFSVAVDQVTKEQRRIAKAVNFGIAYGQGAYGLAETLGIPRKQSSEIIERYFTKFSGIKNYIETTVQKAHEQKYVETLFGRRRYIPELDSSNGMLKKFGERAAINAPIQGTASDLVKMAMIEISQDKLSSERVTMLLQVHDELIFEGSHENIQTQAPVIKRIMENVAKLKVPLKVNFAIGDNWDEAH
ncbi:MAG: DNA polymerase I [Bdellovibrionales bacterium RIFCSPHIGHO2_01_FULL_40_29]|nr:MAG: DNA polymerase I [Bdellovibrionales bacterium RIFCSPHIGHO2_01_FULL_40_29]OFZ35485.1 MAG: DNA polymerase I [Bdellovibrionales bacterium RIFCSPHIGHO2_02_FULL_40_15]